MGSYFLATHFFIIFVHMSKVLFIGDVHGQSEWISYAESAFKSGIEVVFLGDYVDSFHKKAYEIEQNLLRIIAFKKKADNRKNFITKVTLLLGNHDYAYMAGKTTTSGYNFGWADGYRKIFNDNWNLFDVAWGHSAPFTQEYTLAIHAGITATWLKNYLKNPKYDEHQFVKRILGDDAFETKKLHEILNVLKDKFEFLLKVGSVRGGSGTPGPLWGDWSELVDDPIPNINQVVGHTATGIELVRIPDSRNFLIKVDGGKEIQRLIIDL